MVGEPTTPRPTPLAHGCLLRLKIGRIIRGKKPESLDPGQGPRVALFASLVYTNH